MEHRKYHWLYFLLGFLIAVIVASLMGCEQGSDDIGRPCSGMAGMTWEGEACEPEDVWIDRPPVYCCMALTPSCMAQCEGIPEDEWIENTCGDLAVGAEYAGWDEIQNEPIWLCQAEIID